MGLPTQPTAETVCRFVLCFFERSEFLLIGCVRARNPADMARTTLCVRAKTRYYLALHPAGIVLKIRILLLFVVFLFLYEDI